jgi:hypothetical protein
MELKFTLGISNPEILQFLIGTQVCDAYDATVQDDNNSAQGTEKKEDLAS